MKKFISWNVNGIRACLEKGFMDFFDSIDADFFCLQEIKLSEGQLEWNKEGYYAYWNYAQKKGYSGTAIFAKEEPISVSYGIDIEEHDKEGRVITLEYPDFYLVTCYTPNAQRELARIDHRMAWEEALQSKDPERSEWVASHSPAWRHACGRTLGKGGKRKPNPVAQRSGWHKGLCYAESLPLEHTD